jgi:gamma-glutamyltranspeptidase/glutathione hydrolase
MDELQVRFGEELVGYAIGASSCAVPGVPGGLDALWRTHGRLPWRDLVEPALALARDGVRMPPAQASCLAMLEPVMTMREGARIYAPAGRLLQEGDALEQPGLVGALELVRDEGARSVYEGSIARELVRLVAERAGRITAADLAAFQAVWSKPVRVRYAGRTVCSRGDLSGVPDAFARLPVPASNDDLLAVLEDQPPDAGHTTNVTVVDADGSACVLTTSLGLGSGDWLPGLDLHLNSMLGEVDLVREPLRARARMASMMAPTLAFDDEGLELALGSAGGTRLRTALVGVAGAVLGSGDDVQRAIDRPRFHPVEGIINVEPGVDEAWLASLERRGRSVRRWPALHHFFGGVSAIGRHGAGADPRRSGAVSLV